MPVLLAGSAGGALQTGRAIAGSGSIEGIYVALMQALGVNQTSFARAKSPLNGLLARWAATLYLDDRLAGMDPLLYLPKR